MKRIERAEKPDGSGRRDFLKLAALTAPAAVAATAVGTSAQAAAPDPTSEKLQDTVHTRAYYDSARF